MARRTRGPVPHRLLARVGVCAALGGALLTASSCTSPAPRAGGPSIVARTKSARAAVRASGEAGRSRRPGSGGGNSPARATERLAPAPGTTVATRTVIARAWVKAIDAFYTASATRDASLPGLVSGIVPGSPEQAQVAGFLSAQAASGVAGPERWRVGNVRVVDVSGRRATVTGCSADPGSHFTATGLPAPSSLGGGAGLTAYVTEMIEVGATWKVASTKTSTPEGSGPAGPCHGFAGG